MTLFSALTSFKDDELYQAYRTKDFLYGYEPGTIFTIGGKEYTVSEDHTLDLPYGADLRSVIFSFSHVFRIRSSISSNDIFLYDLLNSSHSCNCESFKRSRDWTGVFYVEHGWGDEKMLLFHRAIWRYSLFSIIFSLDFLQRIYIYPWNLVCGKIYTATFMKTVSWL